MKSGEIVSLARRLMRQPAVPFHEGVVRSECEAICDEHGLVCRRDRHGNLLIELRRGPAVRPIVLVAHLDHPGFEIIGKRRGHSWRGRFLGGVPREYFRKGTRLRLMPQGAAAKLGRPLGRTARREYEIEAVRRLEVAPTHAVWELEDVAVRRGRICGRACDDLIGVTAMLATLIGARNSPAAGWLIGAITRAEEVGFGGALALASSRAIPRDSLVISLETSRELPPVAMGKGVVLRVGDRSSVFDSKASRFLAEVAVALGTRVPGFKFQRALMQGGSCEGTVFSEAGYQTAAVCVALGNYHNCGPRKRIAAEFVNLNDVRAMVELLRSAAMRMREFGRLTGRLRRRLTRLDRASRSRLVRSARWM